MHCRRNLWIIFYIRSVNFKRNIKSQKTLLEYLNIEIIKKGKASYVTQESLDKVLKFKEENPNTRAILQKYTCMKKYGVENPQKAYSL